MNAIYDFLIANGLITASLAFLMIPLDVKFDVKNVVVVNFVGSVLAVLACGAWSHFVGALP